MTQLRWGHSGGTDSFRGLCSVPTQNTVGFTLMAFESFTPAECAAIIEYCLARGVTIERPNNFEVRFGTATLAECYDYHHALRAAWGFAHFLPAPSARLERPEIHRLL